MVSERRKGHSMSGDTGNTRDRLSNGSRIIAKIFGRMTPSAPAAVEAPMVPRRPPADIWSRGHEVNARLVRSRQRGDLSARSSLSAILNAAEHTAANPDAYDSMKSFIFEELQQNGATIAVHLGN